VAQRTAKDAARRRAAGALLPGLIQLAGVIGGGSPPDAVANAVIALVPASSGLPVAGLVDPCAFRLDYETTESVVPICQCQGFTFDVSRFRCVSN
jgi:hypothetical protein